MSAPCAVCGSEDSEVSLRVASDQKHDLVATTTAYGAAPADIVRCRVCGHMQVADMPAAAELAEAYEEVSEGAYLDEAEGQRATADRALAQIERHVEVGALCDLGCWVGFLLSEAERRGWRGQGVEPSAFAAAYAREQLGLDVAEGLLESADLPEGHFDAVVMADVLEHLHDPGAALDRVHALLRPGGVIYLALPDAGGALARRLGARWWSVIPTHVHYFTRTSLSGLLARRGFAVEWIDTAPKAFTVAYYLNRFEGYSPGLASALVAGARAVGVADRIVWPDLRDRVAVVARRIEK
jgi:SAM-dependent methyltransferase